MRAIYLFVAITFGLASSTNVFATDVSFKRDLSNPLYKICSAKNIGSNDTVGCMTGYTRSVLENCYGEFSSSVNVESCVGKGRSICRVVSEFDDTLTINYCAKGALEVWENLLEVEYNQFRVWAEKRDQERGFKPHKEYLKTQLETSQADWVKYRESKCDFILGIYFDGTARTSYYFNCKINMTAERASYLKTQREFL